MSARYALALGLALSLVHPVSADAKRDALWAAIRSKDVKAVQKALDAGADPTGRNEYGVSSLWLAAEKKNFDVIKLLVDRGADVNARDDIWYMTPLSIASASKDEKTVEL